MGGRGPRAKRGGGAGGGSKRHLGLDPHLGALDPRSFMTRCPRARFAKGEGGGVASMIS